MALIYPAPLGPMAEWLCSGLQIRARRFDSGSGLQPKHHFGALASPFLGPENALAKWRVTIAEDELKASQRGASAEAPV
jgi:hypothetical protein